MDEFIIAVFCCIGDLFGELNLFTLAGLNDRVLDSIGLQQITGVVVVKVGIAEF
jgi:hypothetical protein